MIDYNRYNKGNKRKEVLAKNVNIVLLASLEKNLIRLSASKLPFVDLDLDVGELRCHFTT